MKAQAKATEQEALEAALANRPGGYRDPESDGRAAPARDDLRWQERLMADVARKDCEQLRIMESQLPALRDKMEIHRARREDRAAAETESLIRDQERRIGELKVLTEAAGPWANYSLGTLKNAVENACLALDEAALWLSRYEGLRVYIRPDLYPANLKTLQKDRDVAAEALRKAQSEHDEMLTRLDGIRAELGKLRQRRVA